MFLLLLLFIFLWRCEVWSERYEEERFNRYMKYYEKYKKRGGYKW